jgi:hypothetical protein
VTTLDRLRAAEVLELADRYLATDKDWVKGVARDDGRRCLFIAVDDAAVALAVMHSGFNAAVGRAMGLSSLIRFNDAPSTTFQDIKAALKRGIENLRQA